jgi:hypothetical protein
MLEKISRKMLIKNIDPKNVGTFCKMLKKN